MSNIVDLTETVEIVGGKRLAGALWNPRVGEETLALLEGLRLPEESRYTIQGEAQSILARCTPPALPGVQRTGLVVGYVQSGKTMSFTTAAALARDNGYRVIIVLSGLTLNLFDQSQERLKHDLRINSDRKRWLFFANPESGPDIQDRIATELAAHNGRTILLVVMKNRAWLDHLTRLLARLRLDAIPALIVDDEGDQASLNNDVRSGGESATYERIMRIRNSIPHHTYLQYTATPQAPLLINLIDILSPDFVEILTPGKSYTGGSTFFDGQGLNLIRKIPQSELPSKKRLPTEPQKSLRDALRIYFLGVALGIREGSDDRENRSMMVHPSMETVIHDLYYRWVLEMKKSWARILGRGDSDLDYSDLLEDFQTAHEDLARTVPGLPELSELTPYLHRAVSQTVVHKVNSSRNGKSKIDWVQDYSHILVGGEKLNRGYTVEGLTITYMPRSRGNGQMDTIQQRARWFGYKEDYLGICRVYLSDHVFEAYLDYVDHEDHMREQLRGFRETGRPLKEWRRAFFVAPDLKPTRHAVLSLDYTRGNYADNWFTASAPHDNPGIMESNRKLTEAFVNRHRDSFRPDDGHPDRTEDQIHLFVSGLSLADVYDQFLTQLRYTHPKDSANFTGVLLQIGRFLEGEPNATCGVFRMRKGQNRKRQLNGKGEIENLFQGHSIEAPSAEKAIYPGDRLINIREELSIQLHTLDLTEEGTNRVVASTVPAVAIWVPKSMGAHWLVQPNGQ